MFAPLLCVTLAQMPAPLEVRVLDADTGRGVPLVELETVHAQRFVTDNAGRVAVVEPGWAGREVFFSLRTHGYAVPRDGFGVAGVRLTLQPGRPAEVRLKRALPAERLCRLTGEGLYRDTVMLGHRPPLPEPAGGVAGQDSVQAAIYRGRVWWFWGDTSRLSYPLGLFRTAGATTPVPGPDFDSSPGIAFEYLTDPKTGFARAMMPLPERPEGVVWVFAPCVVPDASAAERLVAHYTRRKGLEGEYEQGIAQFDDAANVFRSVRQLPLSETWRRPDGHPIAHEEGGTRWLLFGSPDVNVRVPATLEAVLDPSRYEAYTCAGADGNPDLGDDGRPRWRWQRERPPTGSKEEAAWVKSGKLKPEHARFLPANRRDAQERVELHSGSVRWNAHRRRWVMLAGRIGGKSSHLGEVWYAEADAPTGPFPTATLVAAHERQTFYNVCHHAFLDKAGGRVVHFEGTYTNDFSGNPERTARYNYNQVLYRLDLDALP